MVYDGTLMNVFTLVSLESNNLHNFNRLHQCIPSTKGIKITTDWVHQGPYVGVYIPQTKL